MKPTLAIDFKGVLALAHEGEHDDPMSWPMMPGARGFVHRAKVTFDLVVVTPIPAEDGPRRWLRHHLGELANELEISEVVPDCVTYLSAHVTRFEGEFPMDPKWILSYTKPWYLEPD